MVAYLQRVRDLMHAFEGCKVNQVPRNQNSHIDALARLASKRDIDSLEAIPVEFLATPSMREPCEVLVITVTPDSWMKPIIDYLQEGKLPGDEIKARRMRARTVRYWFHDDMLYKRRFTTPLLR